MRCLIVLVSLVFVAAVDARPPRRGNCGPGGCAPMWMPPQFVYPQQQQQLVPVPVETKTEVKVKEKGNKTVVKVRTTTAALDELNRQRAQRGLRPYLFDEGLTQGAEKCASIRAANFIHGHLGGPMSDFSCLPQGSHAASAGAGALTPDWGFATCCMYDNYTYAGAAWVMGKDGRQYCSLFVR